MKRPIDLNLVRSFVAVFETGSFSRAAERLSCPRSTVSRAVQGLEQSLGTLLFHRTTRAVRPTAEARGLYERATQALFQLDAALSEVPQQAERPSGVLRLSSPPDLAAAVLAEVCARFVRKHPEVTVELQVATHVVDLVRDGYDFALRVAGGRLSSSGLTAQRVGSVTIQLYASPRYLERAGAPRSTADLDAHPWVVFRGPAKIKQAARQLTLKPVARAAIISDDLSFVREAARRHAGLVALPGFLAKPDVAAGLLSPVLPAWREQSASVFLVRPALRAVPTRAALFRDEVIAFLKEQPLS